MAKTREKGQAGGWGIKLAIRVYVLAALVMASVTSPLPYSAVAIVLLLLAIISFFRPFSGWVGVTTAFAMAALLPLVLEPVFNFYIIDAASLNTSLALVAGLPTLYLLGEGLSCNARSMPPLGAKEGAHITYVPLALLANVAALLLAALMTDSKILLAVGMIIIIYLLYISLRVMRALTVSFPLVISGGHKRVIAGGNVMAILEAKGRSAAVFNYYLKPEDEWFKVGAEQFTLSGGGIKINASISPPFSGPLRPVVNLWAVDNWGFCQSFAATQPLALEVIPRAKYASWLAEKYLEKVGAGNNGGGDVLPEIVIVPQRGMEYYDNRGYQPGDRLKDIDWKHSSKLEQMVVKTFIETGGQTAILTADLTATDADGADKLAYNLISAALTLARNRVPTALAAFDNERVVQATAVANPDNILRQTLMLVKDIRLVASPRRRLGLPDINCLRRNISKLEQAVSPAAQKLAGLLDFEMRAIKETARESPATLALSSVASQVPPPATILLAAPSDANAEALIMTLERFKAAKYNVMDVAAGAPKMPACR